MLECSKQSHRDAFADTETLSTFEHLDFGFVSDFVLRISDLKMRAVRRSQFALCARGGGLSAAGRAGDEAAGN
jgi:hypothetical protein